jgi:hypothetical protein
MTSDVDFLANAYGECDRERRMREIRTSGVTRGVGASTTAVLAPPLLYWFKSFTWWTWQTQQPFGF